MFDKILLCKRPSDGFNTLFESGLLAKIQPLYILSQLVGLEQNKYHYGDVREHTMEALNRSQPILENRLPALLHDDGKYYTQSQDEKRNHK